MADNGKGPWGGSDDNKSPWGQNNDKRPSGNGPGPEGPDLDEMFKQAQDQFGRMFGGGNGGGSQGSGISKGGFGLIVLILIALWGATGFYRVLPEEHGVILTLGKWTSTVDQPGLKYHVPWPVQKVEKVNVTFERRIEVGFRDNVSRRGRSATAGVSGKDVPGESLMLTGDENIVDIDFVVLWRISDAGKYLFEIRNPEKTIKKVAESAMREIIGRTKIQQALTEGRAQIESKTRELMQAMMDDYMSGIMINEVQLQKVDPPRQVVDAFDDVQRARADKERLKNNADAYRNKVIPEARGEAEKLTQEAQAYEQEVIKRAEGDAERFNSVYKAYAVAKTVTKKRIYLETMQEVLKNSHKFVINGDQGVLPYLPLSQLDKKK